MQSTDKHRFPMKLGYDLAGVVVAVGASVTNFKPGDEVYTRTQRPYRGSIAEYCLTNVNSTALKPASMSFIEAASIPLAGITALQALERADGQLQGGLKGKTVYIPGGLSGTGLFAVQLAKNVFGAGKVITTLSTGKIPKIKEYLKKSTPDTIVDYTRENVNEAVGKGNVDFMFDTMKGATAALPVMKKKTGVIVSVSTSGNGTVLKKNHAPDLPSYLVILLNIIDWFYTTYIGWYGVHYSSLYMSGNAKDLESFSRWVGEGKIKTVVGRTAKLSDIEGVRKGCQEVYDGKGTVGKFVIEID
jgi:NADPH:quinone reductase-like Zn-dependent oxidoreductase